MGLDDPAKKMSKSEKQGNDAISLLEFPEDILRKIRGATTDSLHEIRFDKNSPGINNVLSIYALFSGLSHTKVERRFEGKGYTVLKQELAGIIIENLRPLQSRYRELMKDPAHIDRMLTEGASKVRPIAEKLSELQRIK